MIFLSHGSLSARIYNPIMLWRNWAAKASAWNIHKYFDDQKHIKDIGSEFVYCHQKNDLMIAAVTAQTVSLALPSADPDADLVDRFLFKSLHHICWWWGQKWFWFWWLCFQPILWHQRGIWTQKIHLSSSNGTSCCIEERKQKEERKVHQMVQTNSKKTHSSPYWVGIKGFSPFGWIYDAQALTCQKSAKKMILALLTYGAVLESISNIIWLLQTWNGIIPLPQVVIRWPDNDIWLCQSTTTYSSDVNISDL